MGDPNRLEQVLVNLIGNALDAAEGESSPRIDIACGKAGDQVWLSVRDHGPGLSADAQTRLFEPFFTTKAAGVGLGLGLAISAGILRDLGGSLSGVNHPEGGAIFTLELSAFHEENHD
jgi:two-component system C4-dicarboxylate transport sensor histidine kinase DctB